MNSDVEIITSRDLGGLERKHHQVGDYQADTCGLWRILGMYQYPGATLILTLLPVINFIINTDAHGPNLVNFKIWTKIFNGNFHTFFLLQSVTPVVLYFCKINIDNLKYL